MPQIFFPIESKQFGHPNRSHSFMTEAYSIEIGVIRSFVEGSLSVQEFEQALYFNPEMENFLSGINPYLQSQSEDSLYLRLISLNYLNDEDIVFAKGLLCEVIKIKDKLIFDNIIQNLEKWSSEQHLIENTFDSCKISLQNSAVEDAELFPAMNTGIDIICGWKLSEIKLEFDYQSLVFKHGILSYPYIDTQIGLYIDRPESCYFRDLKQIGTYRLIVRLDGEVDDDYLIMDDELVPKDKNLKNQYSIIIQWSDEERLFLITIPELADFVAMPCAQGKTREEALRNGEIAIEIYGNHSDG